ncbi:hypothetical protein PENTCL1PPCAC_17434, partial [Pristionchus entomophagus]
LLIGFCLFLISFYLYFTTKFPRWNRAQQARFMQNWKLALKIFLRLMPRGSEKAEVLEEIHRRNCQLCRGGLNVLECTQRPIRGEEMISMSFREIVRVEEVEEMINREMREAIY